MSEQQTQQQRQAERAEVRAQARRAKDIAPQLAVLPTPAKDAVLRDAAAALVQRAPEILEANARDLADGRANGLAESVLDRLALDESRIEGIAGGLRQVAGLQDPVGEVLTGRTLPNGIQMRKVRVPLGVMGMVYEARPNVTVDAFGLALKSGNAALLRGSKTARHSNAALVAVLQDGAPLQCRARRGAPRRPRRPRSAPRGGAVAAMRQPRLRAGPHHSPRPGGRGDPPRQRAADRGRGHRCDRAHHRDGHGQLPLLHRRIRRHGQGDRHAHQRQDAPGQRLQRDRDGAH